jgi:hypothetical protein
MSNHNYPRRLLDDAIDRAVQELVFADPRPGFRRRVLERLNATPARRSWIPTLLVPAGAVAAVLAVVLLLKPATEKHAPVTPSTSVAQTPAAPAPAVAEQPKPAVPLKSPAPRMARRTAPAPFTFGPRTDRVRATSLGDAPTGDAVNAAADVGLSAWVDKMSRVEPLTIPPGITLRPIEIKEIK